MFRVADARTLQKKDRAEIHADSSPFREINDLAAMPLNDP
jgi:hypothetical protein